MLKRYLYLQTFILLGAVLFSWAALMGQFRNFYAAYGTFWRFADCAIPNPLATPCFYGTLAFIASLVWSIFVIGNPTLKLQNRLRNFLLFGVVFALSVLGYEFAEYYHLIGGPVVSCSPGTFPLLTPCFGGLLFFAVAFGVAAVATKILRLNKSS